MRNHYKNVGILSILCLAMLIAITVIASPLGSANAYLPLVILQRPTPTPSSTGLLLITELLYNPTSDIATEPAGEWVEIYNPGPGPVLLSAYKMGDEPSIGGTEGMLQFPAGTILYPGDVIVVANQGAVFHSLYGFSPDFEMKDTDPFIMDMLSYPYWSTGKVELVNSGDEILLLDGDDNRVDFLTWGDSAWDLAFDPPPPPAGDGESLERSPANNDSDSAADWVIAETPGPYQLDLSTPTPEIPTGPTVLLVSEVLYDLSGDDPAGEWIEIHNAGENNALLADFRLGDEETQGGGEGMYTFPDGAVLYSGQTVVIANQSVMFESLYGFKPDFEISGLDPETPNMIKDSSWSSGSMNLSASGDDVILLDDDGLIVDGLSWGGSTAVFDPSVPNVEPDHSLERYPAFTDTDSAVDWRDQSSPDPGQLDLSPPTITPSPTATSKPEPLPSLILNEIHADPAGDLAGDANGDGVRDTYEDEFLEIVNTTDAPIDLSGWTITDAVEVRHTFTVSSTIPAGCAILIFGGGTPTGDFGNAIVQVASTGQLILNNDGDTVSLMDDTAALIDTYTYGSEGGDNQSITRDPDISGLDPMVKHSQAAGSNGALFSPGTKVDGSSFDGCSSSVRLKRAVHTWVP